MNCFNCSFQFLGKAGYFQDCDDNGESKFRLRIINLLIDYRNGSRYLYHIDMLINYFQ